MKRVIRKEDGFYFSIPETGLFVGPHDTMEEAEISCDMFDSGLYSMEESIQDLDDDDIINDDDDSIYVDEECHVACIAAKAEDNPASLTYIVSLIYVNEETGDHCEHHMTLGKTKNVISALKEACDDCLAHNSARRKRRRGR